MRDTVYIPEFSQFEDCWRNDEGTGLERAERGSTHQATFGVLFMHPGIFASQPGDGGGIFSIFWIGATEVQSTGRSLQHSGFWRVRWSVCVTELTTFPPVEVGVVIYPMLFLKHSACCLTGPWPSWQRGVEHVYHGMNHGGDEGGSAELGFGVGQSPRL